MKSTDLRASPSVQPGAPAVMAVWLIALLSAAAAAAPGATGVVTTPMPDVDTLRFNQVQTLGSHNSYKQAIDASLMLLLRQRVPDVAATLDYQHLPLTAQLDRGLRILEIDVYDDPDGGRYAKPLGVGSVAAAGLTEGPVHDPDGEMHGPGFKVMHVQDLDFRSHCLTLQACLQTLARWSDSQPGHFPIVVTLNAKDEAVSDPNAVKPLPFAPGTFDRLDAEIAAMLGRARLFTPDDLRGNAATLPQAIADSGWPTIAALRGKFVFVLDEGGRKRHAYVQDHPALTGRLMFVNAAEGAPEAAFLVLNDPSAQSARIHEALAAGYLVRTRADADTREARNGDRARRDAAFASGAQFISSDYYAPQLAQPSGYHVQLPGGGVARCNPVTAERTCRFDR